ncbi:MAG: class I SAM-dependent methyltransferase [Cyanobacteria bacterium]|nr:class I SAM-dependent methyltransferase [Cyanobacteriota bacterium]
MSSGVSLVYQYPWIYDFVMKLLYGPKGYKERYEAIYQWIPSNTKVCDVCCGPGTLFKKIMPIVQIDYIGVDLNAGFESSVQAMGGKFVEHNILEDSPLPEADVVVMQASLYHFLPDTHAVQTVIQKLFKAAKHRIIITEPVKNLSTSSVPLISWLAKRAANPGNGDALYRFNVDSLETVLAPFMAQLKHQATIASGREKLYVFDKK